MWSAFEGRNVAGISHRCVISAEKFIGGNEWNHCIASHYNECQGYRCCGLVTECTKSSTSCTPGNVCISFVCQVHQLQWHSSGSQNYVSKHLNTSLTEIWFLLCDDFYVKIVKVLKMNWPGQGRRWSKHGTLCMGEAWLQLWLKEGNSRHKFHLHAPNTCKRGCLQLY